MKKKTLFLSVFLLIAVVIWHQFSGKGSKEVSLSTGSATKTVENVIARRDGVVGFYMSNSELVAKKTANQKALSIVDFLRHGAVLAEPYPPQGIRYLEPATTNHWCAVVAVIPGDEKLSAWWSSYADVKNAAAFFHPGLRMIVVREAPLFSPDWAGITVLHEGCHARDYITSPYEWEDVGVFCEKERDVHGFQNEIMSSLGGEKYSKFLTQLTREIAEQLASKGGGVGTHAWYRSRHYPELDQIFGVPASNLERDFRESSIMIHAQFRLLDEKFGSDESSKYKTLLMKTIYQRNRNLPS